MKPIHAALVGVLSWGMFGGAVAKANEPVPPTHYVKSTPSLETLDVEGQGMRAPKPSRRLATENKEEDIQAFHSLPTHFGVDLGMMVPFGDFGTGFDLAPMFGFHINWLAISPFGFTVSYQRSSAPAKTASDNNKLSVNALNLGAIASFPMKRISPFVKFEGAFYFNDVSFNDGRRITAGNDIMLTTVGLNAGLGLDFVVGREVSVGLDVTYHYAVPKKLTLTDGTTSSQFDLGSSFVTIGLRVNF